MLLTAEPANLRRTRAKVIRLAKAWNKQYSKPGLSSFNIEALALEAVTEGAGVPDGLAAFFAYAASDLTKRLTPDPAGVSDPIKVLVDRDIIVSRLRHAADLIRVALEHDDDELKAGEALAELYWIHVKPPPGSTSKAAFAAALRQGNAEVSVASGLILGAGKGAPIKTTRSYGGHQR
ncbi:MAG: hypothetical protein Q8P50_11325 [Bacillota bacterium]|nr:hypothetical protein [Bacillota bacterium]